MCAVAVPTGLYTQFYIRAFSEPSANQNLPNSNLAPFAMFGTFAVLADTAMLMSYARAK